MSRTSPEFLRDLFKRIDQMSIDIARNTGEVARKAKSAAVSAASYARDKSKVAAAEVKDAAVDVAAAFRSAGEGLEKVASMSADDLAQAYRDAAADLGKLADDVAADVGPLYQRASNEVAASYRSEVVNAQRAYKDLLDDIAKVKTGAGHAKQYAKATPRATRIMMAAAALLARQRWMRLRAALRSSQEAGPQGSLTRGRGQDGLSADDHRDLARRTTAYLAQLRGGVAKLGQLASCRPDLVGPVWAKELAALQDDVPPVDVAQIRERIAAELPPTPSKPDEQVGEVMGKFGSFDDTPVAAASLAQVHGATLPDGTRVVVKVQVPGIEDVIAADVASLRAIAGMFGDVPGIDLPTLTDELGRALAGELDYVAEADALEQFAGGELVVPRPIRALSSSRVLTMTRIDGQKLVPYLDAADADTRDRVLAELVTEVIAQVLERGHVHADPHPGNFLVTEGGKLAMLDFGCTLNLTVDERKAYARLVFAIAGNNADAAATELAALGFTCDDPAQLLSVTQSIVGALRPGASVAELDWNAAFAEQIAKAKQLGGLTIPRSFVLLGRVLATVAGLLAHYKPRIQLHPLIAKHLMSL